MIDFIASANGFAPLILLSPLILAMMVAGAYLVRLNHRTKSAAPSPAAKSPASAEDDLFAPYASSLERESFRLVVLRRPLKGRLYTSKARTHDPEGHTAQ